MKFFVYVLFAFVFVEMGLVASSEGLSFYDDPNLIEYLKEDLKKKELRILESENRKVLSVLKSRRIEISLNENKLKNWHLLFAVETYNEKKLRELLSDGANPNVEVHIEIITEYRDYKEIITRRRTPLYYAVSLPDFAESIAGILIDKGALLPIGEISKSIVTTINQKRYTKLLETLKSRGLLHQEFTQIEKKNALRQEGASVDLQRRRFAEIGKRNSLELEEAVKNQNYDLLERLLQKYNENSRAKMTQLYIAALNIEECDRFKKMLEFLQTKGVDINGYDERLKVSVLEFFIQNMTMINYKKIWFLLGKRADIIQKNSKGDTPLDLAVKCNQKFFVTEIADIFPFKRFPRLFISAATLKDSFAFQEMVRTLIKARGDINAIDPQYGSVLHYLVKTLNLTIDEKIQRISFLISMGAEVNREDESGKIAYDYALERNYASLLPILSEEANKMQLVYQD